MDRKQQEKQARRRWVRRVRDIKVTAFFGFLIVMGLIGLMWFARPSTSKVEKRDLAKFPTLTWSSFGTAPSSPMSTPGIPTRSPCGRCSSP